MRYSLLLVLLIVTMLSLSANAQKGRKQSSSTNHDLIGFQKEHLADGCGCTYHFKNEPNWTAYSNVYSDDFGKNAWMNIDGQDVKLKLVSSVSVPKGEARKGQRTTSRYVAPGINIRIVTVVGKDYGEGNDYAGTITVT